jgi:hypothetical protein
MTLITPLPSPRGTNRERLYIIKGGARRSGQEAAYDERGGLLRSGNYDDVDPVQQIADWVTANLDDEAQARLIERLAARPAPAQDDEPSLDPYATRQGVNRTLERKRQLNGAQDAKRRRIAQDTKFASVLKASFKPGTQAKALEGRHAMDAAIASIVEQRLKIKLPAIDAYGVREDARVGTSNRATTDADLFKRYPSLARIGFA